MREIPLVFLACLTLTAVQASLRHRRNEAEELQCTCVPYYLCKDGDVVTGGEGLIDVRRVGDDDDDPAAGPEPRSCGMFHVCCDAPQPEPVVTAPPHVPKCGIRNRQGLATRVINAGLDDDETKMGEFPWQAAVLRKEGKVNVFSGGAALVSPRMLVTAAHTVKDTIPGDLRVRLGEYDTQTTGEFYKHVDCEVAEVVINPKVSYGALLNDIALLVLTEPVQLAPNIDTVCLPGYQDRFDGNYCTVTGWGKNAFELNGTYQSILKQVDVPVVERNKCQAQMRETRLGRYFKLHPSFICAGGEEGQDACKGDGGGPLSCEVNGQYKLAGIVAWGIGCGQKDVPGVYVNVAEMMPWLEEEINKRGGLQ